MSILIKRRELKIATNRKTNKERQVSKVKSKSRI